MAITLFAIIGATINAGVGYWICYGIFCAVKLFTAIKEVMKEMSDGRD